MKEFKLWNNIAGWIVFLVAAFTYILTSEPTASLWDCGEYISTAYKLQVGHPPGAPFFQLVGNFFSLFASDIHHIARMVNTMSALSSAFSILFLFWSITHLARKFFSNGEEFTMGNRLAILMSGAVGALAYTFSDSFWFSAVEGEVYAMSSFFTAIVFWAMLKWEDSENDKAGFKWILLIAYLIGLSVGVHLLNLLAIPAITMIYYFKKYKPSIKGMIFTGILSIVLLAVVMYVIIPWVIILAGSFERFFVNSFGMPFHTGTIVYFLMLFGGIGFGLYYTQKKAKVIANVIILSFTFIVIGYSSFFILVVRSNANTPIDENNPEDAISLLSYLNREQYGDWPLFKGQYFNAPMIDATDGNPVYTKSYAIVLESSLINPNRLKLGDSGLETIFPTQEEAQAYLDKSPNKALKIKQAYVLTDERKQREPVYDERFVGVFPRMWSNQREAHASVYQEYMKDQSKKVSVTNPQTGAEEIRVIPSFADNLSFFFKYQIGHMYLRYFMWNFSGRQNDIQGHGEKINGNWISGITALDEMRLGPQDDMPVELKNNKGRNKYFMLPLILGLIGLFFQFNRKYKDGIVVMFLFLMTGLAIVIYLNQYPYQPRERDYAYAASFYAFAIWIGLGVLAIYEFLKKFSNPVLVASATGVITLALVPGIMANQNWDDHDRSGRYNTLNVAVNYLESCAPNAILFTNGDNDTFPLWYAQEVEGIRTDIKIVNLSLFNTDWYVDQMVRKTYKADPIPMSIGRDKYIQGTNDIADFYQSGVANKDEFYDIRKLTNFFFSTDPKTKVPTNSGEMASYIPTNKCMIPVDRAKVIRLGIVSEKDSALIVDAVRWTITEGRIQKNNLMMMEMLASFNWDRPIYYAITTGADAYLNLMEYFRLEGMAYRLVPVKNPNGSMDMGSYGTVNTDILYNNMMVKFNYDGINNPKLYFDENHMRSVKNYRSNFARLAKALADEGKNDKAKKVLDKAMEVMPEKTVAYDYFMIPIAESYYRIGDSIQANKILTRLVEIYSHDLNYYYNKAFEMGEFMNEKNNCLFILQAVGQLGTRFNQMDIAKRAEVSMQKYMKVYNDERGNIQQ